MKHVRRQVFAVLASLIGLSLVAQSPVATAAPSPQQTARATPQTNNVAPAKATSKSAKTSAKEKRRVDRVRATPVKWFLGRYTNWGRKVYYGTTKLPLDYDNPRGTKVEIALAKLPATDPARKIGTLFVNPGGPGGSGVDLAAAADSFLSPEILERFDIVGFDPRGTNSSTNVRCFATTRESTIVEAPMDYFPNTTKERKQYFAAAKKFAKGCSSRYGRTLASSVSTTETARDMDVLRRLVGDKKLSYLGFSYGSYLGQVYANMFPDRFRALVIDGVIDPLAWRGTSRTRSVPLTSRMNSGAGAWKALKTTFDLCSKAGVDRCLLSDPWGDFNRVINRLRKGPLETDSGPITYQMFVLDVLTTLYSTDETAEFVVNVVFLYTDSLDHPSDARATARVFSAHKKLQQMSRRLDFSYSNDLDAYSSITCSDTQQPKNVSAWSLAVSKYSRFGPHFAAAWGWQDVQCATKYWKVSDEDRYTGTFTHRTARPVLIVGSTLDPATNYSGASRAHKLLPNSYLITSYSWGHTSYGTSSCVTVGVDNYLLHGFRPPSRCVGDYTPFATPLGTGSVDGARTTPDFTKGLPVNSPGFG